MCYKHAMNTCEIYVLTHVCQKWTSLATRRKVYCHLSIYPNIYLICRNIYIYINLKYKIGAIKMIIAADCTLWKWLYINNIISVKYFIYFKDFFLMWTIFLKALLSLVQYCFCLMFWFFGHEACGILASWPGIEPAPLQWKVKS